MKKFFINNWELISIFLISFLITWPLFVPGYFSHHDDLQVMRIFEMRKCFADFQIPCRWVPDMGYGFGYPLFNFYGPLAYYIGAVASYVLGYVVAAKFLFFVPLVFGGLGMYLLAKELFGKLPGFVAAILYLFAPYRALDAYVRGAIGESFALALIPFVFYSFLKLIRETNKRNFVLAIIFTTLLFVSHNIMTLIFTPFIILWLIFLLYRNNWKGFKVVLLGLILSFGLSAFFIIPAFFEKGLVQTESLTRAELDFRAQFVKVPQLFLDRSWNYSGSQPQSSNTISYQIGWPHWIIVLLTLFILIIARNKKDLKLFMFLFAIFIFGVFMTHNKSAPIWESIKILAFVQFPWRFLSIAVFSVSLLGGYFLSLFNKKWLKLLSILIVVLTIVLNWQYFRPEHFYRDVTDESKLTGQNFVDQQKGSLLDYLPKTALEPREPAPQLKDFIKKSNSWQYSVKINKNSTIEIPVFDFPIWETNYLHKTDSIGRIAFDLAPGDYVLKGKLTDTPVRKFGNTLTLVSFLILITIYAKGRKIFK